MFPQAATDTRDSPAKPDGGSPSKVLRTPKYHHLPPYLPTTNLPLPMPPYALATPPSVTMLRKHVGPHSVYQLLRYFGLPNESGMYTQGYAPFQNACIAFLVANRHRERA
jgi:hypothetical protein